MASVKSNIILNGINTITGILFPIITFPYAARILLPNGIGAINFLNSIVSYIILLTSLGIPLYAVKEVAKYRDNRESLNRITLEIIILSIFLSLLGYVAVWFLGSFIPQIHNQAPLFYILSLSILLTAVGVNWFYQGIEDFKFITIRAIIIRSLAAGALFIFVKSPADLLIYGIITVGSTVGNNFINFIHLRKYIKIELHRLKELKIFKHLKPALHIFTLTLITSLYVQLNSIMLGFMSGDTEVGYFTAGTKISHIGLTLITSIGTVLLPRCSNLIKIGDVEKFNTVIKKSLDLTLALSLPMCVGLMILSMPVTTIFCGEDYLASIPVLYLNAPVIILIGLTNIMGIQILYPKDKTNLVIISVAAAAVINLVLNFFLIPLLGATGAAISTLFAEISVLLIQAIAGRKYYPFGFRNLFNIRYILATIIMGIGIYVTIIFIHTQFWQLIIGSAIGIIIYFGCLILMKDPLLKFIYI